MQREAKLNEEAAEVPVLVTWRTVECLPERGTDLREEWESAIKLT